ncbi:MAG TPA: glycosyltransferase family 4 protein [Xanthomonadaceae bacterium]|nr:glycosyltransferase family 4 protein [Xanthomonadaceae bacterium]
MRILVVSDLPQFVTGGAEMQAARLIEAWLDAGHEVRCLGRRMGARSVRIGRHVLPVARIRTTSLLGRYGRAASYFLSLAWLLWRNRRWAQVVYTRFLGEAAATAAILKASGVLRLPLVATPANTRGNGDINLLRSLPLGGRLIGLLDRECDAINLIAADMVAELRAAGFSGRNFTRIPNGIRLAPPPARAQRDRPRFLAVGRLTPQKGYDVLLSALASMREAFAPGQVRIVGDGPERDALASQAVALGVADIVHWVGEASQDVVVRCLDDADVFLLPSRYEGLSNAGLEAMERALPLVLTRCGGLDHYVDPSVGWVVASEDASAFAGALAEALAATPARRARMGLEARRRLEHEFDMAVVAARYAALFQALHEGRPWPEPTA